VSIETKPKKLKADSGKLRGYYAIINPYGDFWSHTVHGGEAAARDYIRRFWGTQTDVAEEFLRKCKIIEVRVRLEPLDVEEAA
jgi:hypothetical protein